MRDLLKRGLFQPLKKTTQDYNVPMGRSNAYCTYHQRNDHATNFCEELETTILDLIVEGKYRIDQ